MQKNGKGEHYTWFDHALGSAMAFPFIAVIHIVAALFRKRSSPVQASNVTGPVTVDQPVVSKMSNLPTPDIFKGAPNLAPAKQFRL